jgi:tRNA A-37 threonylcarbamoyl transferase component Bud32/tetratricopeptide (TPR) repeat protein
MSRTADRDERRRNLRVALRAARQGIADEETLLQVLHQWWEDPSLSVVERLGAQVTVEGAEFEPVSSATSQRLDETGEPMRPASVEEGPEPDTAATESRESASTLALSVESPGSGPEGERRVSTCGVGPEGSLSRFRKISERPHAIGGMGQVFLAEDLEVGRRVAVKELRPHRVADPSQWRRLRLEAEVTGRLEHPGIVPIYGLCAHESGAPFYAMRFITGTATLHDAIRAYHEPKGPTDPRERAVAFRTLLGRLIDVCHAMEYAHRRGVIHRDLKPRNIMVGEYGETLVVDWGLARTLKRAEEAGDGPEPGEDETLALESVQTSGATIVGTPAYMSPEQARSDPMVGPAADVYSLGAVLFEILTGRNRFVGCSEPLEVLARLNRGDLPRPRDLDPSIDPALEAICLKATASDPADRYDSARALRADLEHWLADEPVAAWREPWGRRLRRWMRRHRTIVAASGVGLVVTLLGLAVFLAILAGLNRELDATNRQLGHLNRDLDRRNAELAEMRSRSEDRERLAIDAVRGVRDAVLERGEFRERPELAPLRESLLGGPLAFFGRLRDHLRADGDARPEALLRLSLAHRDLALTTAGLRGASAATPEIERAESILRPLVHAHPDQPAYRASLARVLVDQGRLARETGRREVAVIHYREARVELDRLVRQEPARPEHRALLALTLHDLGVTEVHLGHPERGVRLIEEGVAHQRLALERSHDHPAYRLALLDQTLSLADVLLGLGQRSEALAKVRGDLPLLRRHPDRLYRVAALLARASSRANDDDRRLLADEAVALLNRAVQAGWHDWPSLDRDGSFDALRDRADVRALVLDGPFPDWPFAQ